MILLYGPDGYRRDARKNLILREAGEAPDIRLFDATDEDAPRAFLEFISSSSLFDKRRIALVSGAADSALAHWIPALKASAGTSGAEILLIEDDKPKEDFDFLLDSPVKAECFEYLERNEWLSFIKTEAAERGLALGGDVHAMLAERHRKNTWGLITELERLRGLGHAEIRVADLAPQNESPADFWNTLNRLKNAERPVRLRTLEELLLKMEPAKLFYTLAAVLYGREEAAARADLAVKSGKVEYEEALLGLLL